MIYHEITTPDDERIWKEICAYEGHIFHTYSGLPFSFTVKWYKAGEALGELVIDRKKKTITRNTVLMGHKKAMELGTVTGPKKLGVFGASYLYPIFLAIGVCKKVAAQEDGAVQ